MKKSKKLGFVKGGLIGATLGVAAGIAFAPESGKKTRSDIKKKISEFNSYLSPMLNGMKVIGEGERSLFIKNAMGKFSKAKRVSKDEEKSLLAQAKKSWKHLKSQTI